MQDQWQMVMNNNLSRNNQSVEFFNRNLQKHNQFFANKQLFSKWKVLDFIPISYCQKEFCYREFWAAAKVIVMSKSSFSIEIHGFFSREVANCMRNIHLLCLPNKYSFCDVQEMSYNKHMTNCLQEDFLQAKKVKCFSLAKNALLL